MLTGDNRGAAAAVAGELGIDAVHAAVLPGDKAAIAGAAMAFSSVSVVLNALTLRRWRGSADAHVAQSRHQQPRTGASTGEQPCT